MYLYNLDKNNENLLEAFVFHWKLITQMKLLVAFGPCWPGSGFVVGPQCWPLAHALNTLFQIEEGCNGSHLCSGKADPS